MTGWMSMSVFDPENVMTSVDWDLISLSRLSSRCPLYKYGRKIDWPALDLAGRYRITDRQSPYTSWLHGGDLQRTETKSMGWGRAVVGEKSVCLPGDQALARRPTMCTPASRLALQDRRRRIRRAGKAWRRHHRDLVPLDQPSGIRQSGHTLMTTTSGGAIYRSARVELWRTSSIWYPAAPVSPKKYPIDRVVDADGPSPGGTTGPSSGSSSLRVRPSENGRRHLRDIDAVKETEEFRRGLDWGLDDRV
jgi:hypothetical protein